jgi:hypothetical protein
VIMKHRSVPGHDDTCIVNWTFTPDSAACDCGAMRDLLARARKAACQHKMVGFRTAKVCVHCGQTKAEIKAGV